MKPFLEPPLSALRHSSLVVFERRESSYAWNWHYHPEIELTYIRKGAGMRLVGDHSEAYGPGDLILLGPNLPHTWFTTAGSDPVRLDNNQAIVLQFRSQMFPEAMLALPELAAIRQLLERASRGLHFHVQVGRKIGAQMKSLIRQKSFRRWLTVASVLSELASRPARVLASAGYQHKRSYQLSSRIERITAYMERRCGEDIPLAKMATLSGLSPTAFSRFFRKMTNQTFVDYRNSCRIRQVCRLLSETDLSITEIAYKCGYGNMANFNRRFLREKQMAPRDFRRLHNLIPMPGKG
jgi:AraC-like DNA-binding protein